MSFRDLERGIERPQGDRTQESSRNEGNEPIMGSDPSFAALTSAVSNGIFSIQRNNQILARLQKQGDSEAGQHRIMRMLEETREKIKSTSEGIKQIPEWRIKSGADARTQKYEQEKLSRDFELVLQEFQSIQQSFASKTKTDIRHLQEQQYDYQHEDSGANNQQQQQQISMMEPDLAYNETLIAEREDEIRDIEHGIQELNEIFRDLGTMVTEQQSTLDNIEVNVSNMASNMKNASRELTTAARYQRSSRNKACCLFIILGVVGTIVLLAVVLS